MSGMPLQGKPDFEIADPLPRYDSFLGASVHEKSSMRDNDVHATNA
jgi:hypothetical protein